jgi:hypothetical protein
MNIELLLKKIKPSIKGRVPDYIQAFAQAKARSRRRSLPAGRRASGYDKRLGFLP